MFVNLFKTGNTRTEEHLPYNLDKWFGADARDARGSRAIHAIIGVDTTNCVDIATWILVAAIVTTGVEEAPSIRVRH